MPTNLRDKFLPVVPLKPGERCELKNHFEGVLRELVGWLDSQAKKHPKRFVYAFVTTLARKCKKGYKSKEHYSVPYTKKVLEFLRDLAVATVRFPSTEQRGRPKWGISVLRHDDLACRRGDCCEWFGLGGQEPKPGRRVMRVSFLALPWLANSAPEVDVSPDITTNSSNDRLTTVKRTIAENGHIDSIGVTDSRGYAVDTRGDTRGDTPGIREGIRELALSVAPNSMEDQVVKVQKDARFDSDVNSG